MPASVWNSNLRLRDYQSLTAPTRAARETSRTIDLHIENSSVEGLTAATSLQPIGLNAKQPAENRV